MPTFDDNGFFFRLYGKINKPIQYRKIWSFADYFAMGMVLPHALLCGAMAIAGMILLTGIPWIAITAGICSFAITYLRFGQYAPQLFRKIPFTLFKEIDEKGNRNEQYIQEYDRLTIIVFFIFVLTPISACIITFFSLSLMKNAFNFLGIAGVMSFGGISMIPALSFFGLACFLCTWSMFSDGASTMFARKDFWPHLSASSSKLLCQEPDSSLLLPGEEQDTLGKWLFVRQCLRLILVLAALGLISYGNYVVGLSGVHFMVKTLGMSWLPVEITDIVLPGCMLIGSAAFIVGATNHLITLFILSMKFISKQLEIPILVTLKETRGCPPYLRGLYLLSALMLTPLILTLRAVSYVAYTEYKHITDTIVSPHQFNPNDNNIFHDCNTVFNHLRCNTNIKVINFLVNTFVIIPLTLIIGLGIFCSLHVKLFATINAINTGAMAYNAQIPMVNNYLGMSGYLVSSLNFSYRTIQPSFSISNEYESSNIKTILFCFPQQHNEPSGNEALNFSVKNNLNIKQYAVSQN